MSDDLKALGQRFYDEVFNKGNLDFIDEMLTEDFVEHEEMPGMGNDKAGVMQWFTLLREAFPDMSIEVLAMAADGDQLLAHAIMRATHQGEFMGLAASGRSVEVAIFDRLRFRDGRCVDHWGVTDTMAMMEQLGATPEDLSPPAG